MTSIARMYYLDGLGQNEIATICGISRSTVSRTLTTARKQGVVRISVDDYDPRDSALERALCERFNLKRAVVVRNMGEEPSSVRRTIGYYASTFVAKWLAGARTIGVAGGRILADVVHFMEVQPERDGIEVVQLVGRGGPVSSRFDASGVSRAVASRFRGRCAAINALAIAESGLARDVVAACPQTRSVWNRFASLDVALVEIGTLEEPAFTTRPVIDDDSRAELRRAGAVGEMCGRFFGARGGECQTSHRARVVGIDLETLRSCPEVVAVISGATPRAAVLAAIAGGLVRSLVIDEHGAAALLKG